jgi:hypothetical protein
MRQLQNRASPNNPPYLPRVLEERNRVNHRSVLWLPRIRCPSRGRWRRGSCGEDTYCRTCSRSGPPPDGSYVHTNAAQSGRGRHRSCKKQIRIRQCRCFRELGGCGGRRRDRVGCFQRAQDTRDTKAVVVHMWEGSLSSILVLPLLRRG